MLQRLYGKSICFSLDYTPQTFKTKLAGFYQIRLVFHGWDKLLCYEVVFERRVQTKRTQVKKLQV